jgi:hypothetical protein
MKPALMRMGRLLRDLAKELSDERAYERHLRAHGAQHSAEQWRKFHECRLSAKYSRAKCC